METKPILAIMYDFDKTLSPREMQEYGLIPELGMDPGEFWGECTRITRAYKMDQMLSYMYLMVKKARGKMLLNREKLVHLGEGVQLFPGVETWFSRVNAYAESRGLVPEHYILSSGLKEIIEGTSIAKEFKEIYAASFVYDEDGVPCWPAMAVNYTSKTQFMFRINKGVLDVTENRALNDYMPSERRRVPFTNMIYIGDGYTDVPCMRVTKINGGHSIAVWQKDRTIADRLLQENRVDFVCKADYSQGTEMEETVFAVIDQVAAQNRTMRINLASLDRAMRQARAKGNKEKDGKKEIVAVQQQMLIE